MGGHCPSPPKIKLLTGERQREYVLSDETIEAFYKRGTTMGRLVAFLCDTGLRRAEACNLTWAAVESWLHSIEVLKGKTKYARRRIPLTRRAERILTEIKERQRLAGVDTDYVFTLRDSMGAGTMLALRGCLIRFSPCAGTSGSRILACSTVPGIRSAPGWASGARMRLLSRSSPGTPPSLSLSGTSMPKGRG